MRPFQFSEEGVYKRLWAKIVRFEEAGLPVLSTSHSFHIERASQAGSTYAYINEVSNSRLVATKSNCTLLILPETFFSNKYAVGMQNNSVYKEVINDV